jgi:hypothetical protein
MTTDGEKDVVSDVQRHLDNWRRLGDVLRAVQFALGIIAILSSLAVASKITFDSQLVSWLAYTAALAVTLQTALNLGGKANRFRDAQRILDNQFLRYKAGDASIVDLIRAKKEGEKAIGNFSDVIR